MSPAQASRPTRAGLVVEQCWQRVPGGSATYITELTQALLGRSDIDPVGLSALHLRDRPASVGNTTSAARRRRHRRRTNDPCPSAARWRASP